MNNGALYSYNAFSPPVMWSLIHDGECTCKYSLDRNKQTTCSNNSFISYQTQRIEV